MIIDRIKKRIAHEQGKLLQKQEDEQAREIVRNGPRPIYHIHIRKTAGTSINYAFIDHVKSGQADPIYHRLIEQPNHRVIINGKVIVGWNMNLINEGSFSYAFSHTPMHQLQLPENVFRFTCLRDPAKRVLSHYNMLRHYERTNPNHPTLKTEGQWLGNSFDDFLDKLPKAHRLNQLHMFSEAFGVEEAFEQLGNLNKVMFTDQLDTDLKELADQTGWKLKLTKQKEFNHKSEITSLQHERLRELMEPEYVLLDRLRSSLQSAP